MNSATNHPIGGCLYRIALAGMILALCFGMSGTREAWAAAPVGMPTGPIPPAQTPAETGVAADIPSVTSISTQTPVFPATPETPAMPAALDSVEAYQIVPGSDFDGDGRTDPSKFVPSSGTVWWLKSSTGSWDGQWLGGDAFTVVPGSDFDGDGRSDPAKFYPGTGTVWWVKSSTGALDGQWLGPDLFTYVSGSDFDGDGKTDPAKFYPDTGTVWWVKSSTGTLDGQWLGGDAFQYVPGSDFDGDGRSDPAKFYPGTGTVWWVKSSTGTLDGMWLGPDTFTYVPASDFDGDGRTDPAKFYPGTGTLWWVKSSTGLLDGVWLGGDTFTYVAGCDFDGDGKTDPARFHPDTGGLWWLSSSTGTWDSAELGMTGTLSLTDFANYRVFQRDIGGTSKSVTISGTYANMTWSRIEARLLRHATSTVVLDWATLDATYGGGAFSGSLTVPQGGWYNTEVRAVDGSGAVLASSRGTDKWGVGMLILVIGQSNMSGRGLQPFSVASSDLAVNYSNAGIWEHLADPYDDDSPPGAVDSDNATIASTNSGGSMVPAIANSLLQTFDFPIAFVPASKGGTPLHVSGTNGWAYRNTSNHFDTSTLYGQSITKAQSVGGVELIIMHQGEQDLTDGRSQAQYMADFATMLGHYRQDLYASIPIFICQLGTVGQGTNAGVVGIRSAQHDLDNATNIFMGATAMELPRQDTWHYDTPGQAMLAARQANAIKYYFGQSGYYRGPSISSAFFSDGNRNQVIVSLTHHGGSDITPLTGITGFEVFDNGTSVAITSAVRYASNAVSLTLSRTILTGHTVTLRYLYGMTPVVTGLVKDNSALALPLENTTADITVADPALP